MTFADLNLNNQLQNALAKMGITKPTAIQAKAFGPIMAGRDVIGIAQTGTGKTFAYLLPCLRLWKFTKSPFPQVLIIVPTRELVLQVTQEVEKLTEFMSVEVVGVYGGTNIKKHKAEVEVGVDVLVGTPGRLVDLLKDGVLKLRNIKQLVLDEVDESVLKICFDTGHHSYAGFDPVAFMEKHIDRISYMHFKDIDPLVKSDVVRNRTNFYDACGQGIFCNLGDGDVDFPAVRQVLIDSGFEGWCTVEQDCDPEGDTSPIDDAKLNRNYLQSIGFEGA